MVSKKNKCSRILFVQPPTPLAAFDIIRENILTAAGYLISFAKKDIDISGDFEFILLNQKINDYAGDAALLKKINAINPQVVCFSCYCWNIARIKYLAQELRKTNKNLKIIFGGPEISVDNDFLLTNLTADFLVTGEGELTFLKLLAQKFDKSIITNGCILFDNSKNKFISLKTEIIDDLNNLPSPYITQVLNIDERGFLRFETQRGCVRKCSYCNYSKNFNKIRFYNDARILSEIKFALENNGAEIFFLDPDFLIRPELTKLLTQISALNFAKQLEFHTELDALRIDNKIAKLLGAINLKSAEIGLQTIHNKTLHFLNRSRKLDRQKFIENIKLLKENGVDTIIDIILGLPGETAADIRKTFDFIIKNNLQKDIQVFNLAVLPNTMLRANAQIYGLQYLTQPPYYCINNSNLDADELSKLFNEAEELFDTEFDAVELPSFVLKNKNTQNIDNNELEYFNKLIIDCSVENKNYYNRFFNYMDKCANNVCLWFRDFQKLRLLDLLIDFINKLTTINPNTVFEYIIELNDICDINFIHRLFANEVINNSHYLNYYYSFDFGKDYCISSKKIVLYSEKLSIKKKWITELIDTFYCVKKIEINNENDILNIKKK